MLTTCITKFRQEIFVASDHIYTFVPVSILISFCLYFILTGTHIRAYANTYTQRHEDSQKRYWGRGAQDIHLDFHTAPELFVSVLLHVHRDCRDCQRRGAQDVHLDFHTALKVDLQKPVFYAW